MAPRGLARFLCRAFQKVLAFSLLVSVVLLLLYGLGNFQGFLDATQYLLLDLANLGLWIAFASSLVVLALLVVNGILERRFALVRFLGTLLAAGISGALVGLLEFLAAWVVR